MKASDSRRLRGFLEAASLAATLALFYWPYLRLQSLTTGGDMANLFYPTFTHVADTIAREGVWPLWNPYGFCGHPMAATAQSAVFYLPGRILYGVFGGAPVAAMNLFLLLHLLWAGLGTWAFARARTGLGLRGFGPWCAGLAFAGSAWWWGQVEHAAALATTSWLPWLVWSAGWMARCRSARSVCVCAIVLALAFLAGHPQEAFYSLLAAGAWALWCGWRFGGLFRIRATAFTVLRFLGCVLLAGMIAAVQWVPTLELGRLSYRRFDGPDYAAQYSLPPELLVLLLLPHAQGSYADGFEKPWAFNEYGIYVGVPALALALAGWVQGRARRRSRQPGRGASALWGAVAVGAVLLALGGNADLRRVVAPGRVDGARPADSPEAGWSPLALELAVFPPARHFRVPARHLVLWSFAVALLAAQGLRSLEIIQRTRPGGRNATRRRRALIGIQLFLAALIFISLFGPTRKERMAYRADYPQAMDFAREIAPTFPNGPALENRIYRLTLLDDDLLARDSSAPQVTSPDVDLESRVAARAAILLPDLNLLSGHALLDGYEEGLLPTVRYKDFLFTFNRSFRDANPDARLLALGGVRWLWSDLPIRSAEWEPTRTSARTSAMGTVYRNTLWRGAAFDKSTFPSIDWSALEGTYGKSGLLSLQRGQERLPYTTSSSATSTSASGDVPDWAVEVETVNSLVCRRRAEVPAPDRRMILAQASYPGWVARDEEGRVLPLRLLNAWNLEVGYSAAQTTIRFSYEPWSFRVGAFATCVGVFVLGALIGFRPRRAGARS